MFRKVIESWNKFNIDNNFPFRDLFNSHKEVVLYDSSLNTAMVSKKHKSGKTTTKIYYDVFCTDGR